MKSSSLDHKFDDLEEEKNPGALGLPLIDSGYFASPYPIQTMKGLGLKWFADKSGGGNKPGKLGAWYKDKKGNLIFVKQDVSKTDKIHHDKNICEVIASRLMHVIDKDLHDSIAKVNFITESEKISLPDRTGENIYVASACMGTTLPTNEEKFESKSIDPGAPLLEEEFKYEAGFEEAFVAYQTKFNDPNLTIEEVYKKLYHSPYMDLWKDAYLAYNFAPEFSVLRDAHGSVKIPSDRPKLAGSWNQFPLKQIIESNRYEGLAKHIALRVFLDDPDQHSANYGAMVIPGNPNKKTIGSIDFAAAMKDLDGKLHFREILRYLPGIGPTNHVREYPESIVISDEFADEFKRIGNFSIEKLKAEIGAIIDELDILYGKDPILEVAKRLNVEITNPKNKKVILQDIHDHLVDCFTARQKAAREMYFEVKVSLCFEKNANGEFTYGDARKEAILENLIVKNRQYFKNLLKADKMIKFRREDQKDDDEFDRLNFLLRAKVQDILSGNPMHLRNTTFHQIFNANKIERFAADSGAAYVMKTLMGYPNKGNPYNWLEWLVAGLGLLTLAKNAVKLVTEYLPAVLAEGCEHLAGKCRAYLNINTVFRSPTRKALAHVGEVAALGLAYLFKGVRLLAMRLSSPIQACKQAYRFGNRHSTPVTVVVLGYSPTFSPLGVALAGLSLALSFAAITTVAFFVAPLFGALGAAMATTFVGAKLVGAIASLGHALMSVSLFGATINGLASAGSAMGIGMVSAAALIVPTLAAFAAVVMMPLRSLFKAVIKSVWRGRKVEMDVPEIKEGPELSLTHTQLISASNRGGVAALSSQATISNSLSSSLAPVRQANVSNSLSASLLSPSLSGAANSLSLAPAASVTVMPSINTVRPTSAANLSLSSILSPSNLVKIKPKGLQNSNSISSSNLFPGGNVNRATTFASHAHPIPKGGNMNESARAFLNGEPVIPYVPVAAKN